MTAREHYRKVLQGERVSPPILEICGFWEETVDRWRGEGMPAAGAPSEHLPLTAIEELPVETWLLPRFAEETLEETSQARLVRCDDGVVRRFPSDGRLATEVEFPVADLTGFHRVRDERLNADDPARMPSAWSEVVAHTKVTENVVLYRIGSVENWLRELMGFEEACMALLDDSSPAEAMFQTAAEFSLRLIDRVFADPARRPAVDAAYLRSDLTSGGMPLMSPRQMTEKLLSHYQQIIQRLQSYGVDIFLVSSDGNCEPLIPVWAEAGFNGMFPVERAAMSDPAELRRRFADFALIGGIDKRALARDNAAIDAELAATAAPLLELGRWIPSLDHAVPPDVSWDNYRYYLDRLRGLLSN